MHAIFFGTKRVHLEVVYRLTRPLLDATECELTPARFDMMRIVKIRPQGVLQQTLRWLLGVSEPTVSRMLKSLELLGMITRTDYARDGRCRMVHITAKGAACVEIALAATIGVREDSSAVARCATGDTSHRHRNGNRKRISYDETTAIIDGANEKVDALDRTLERMRRALGDCAPFHHPWRTTDVTPLKVHTFVDGSARYGDEWPLDPDWNPTPIWSTPSWRAPA